MLGGVVEPAGRCRECLVSFPQGWAMRESRDVMLWREIQVECSYPAGSESSEIEPIAMLDRRSEYV
jgi:hypothetical protein